MNRPAGVLVGLAGLLRDVDFETTGRVRVDVGPLHETADPTGQRWSKHRTSCGPESMPPSSGKWRFAGEAGPKHERHRLPRKRLEAVSEVAMVGLDTLVPARWPPTRSAVVLDK